MTQSPSLSIALGLGCSALFGAGFTWLGVPLGWILGAMAGAALYGNTAGITGRTRNLRRAGQLIVGTATAGVLTPALLDTMGDLLPAMVGAAIAANAFGLLLAWPLARIAGTDRTTALLSSLPAGMAEMATLAKQVNARTEIVTVVHTLRVILVVVCVPFFLGVSGSAPAVFIDTGGSMAALLACLGLGLAFALVSDRLGLLNPYIIMPMVIGIAFVLSGFRVAQMPVPLLIAAQVLIGFSLGARLKSEDLARMPRAALAGIVCGLALIAFMVLLVAPVLNTLTGTDLAVLMLGVAPGGLGEMIASAKALGVASALVAGFQFVRSFLTNMIVPPLLLRFAAGSSSKGNSNENP
ncbi:AbrB family transcriptional regulator [Hoeflea ulvae]|uniref:AbrB family transcriptional regulator n=1 Tax=Hoeflea ulvae TaxID=2983764 RepID=A0ABT3YD70_9HYPH|nr:AbrB family transcriptional regulator [Hoeflea ulvae]MCY0093845.1 AbrB family transcriptional regulator [Hoeflea ulvae]